MLAVVVVAVAALAAAVRRPSPETLQWIGLLAAPLGVGGAARRRLRRDASPRAARGGRDVALVAWELALTARRGRGRARRPGRGRRSPGARRGAPADAPAGGRIHFFADAALLANTLFLAMILLGGIAAAHLAAVPPGVRRARSQRLALALALAGGRRGRARPAYASSTRRTASRCHGHGAALGQPGATARRSRRRRRARGGLLPPHRLHAARARRRAAAAQPTSPSPSRELRALVGYVASLGHGPPVPQPHPERGDVAEGMRALHRPLRRLPPDRRREGGYLTGAVAPPLDDATPTQIAEAVRIGPYLMPRFSPRAISDRAARLDRRLRPATREHPTIRGGWPLGRLGPVPGGDGAWLLAGGRARRLLPRDREAGARDDALQATG